MTANRQEPTATSLWHPGALAVIRIGQLDITFRVLAVKRAYGNERLEVEPVAGGGRQWINARRARPVTEKEKSPAI